MSAQTLNISTRVKALNVVLTDTDNQQLVEKALTDAGGNWSVALGDLKNASLSEASLNKLQLAYLLADLSGDNVAIVKALSADPQVTNLRDVALRYNVDKLSALVDGNTVLETVAGNAPEQKQRNVAITLNNKLFHAETSAVLQRMVQEAQIPIADLSVRSNVATIFANVPEFNIRTTSIYHALQNPLVFQGIPDEQRADAVEQLKILQRVQAISPVPDAVSALMKANLTSAFDIAEKPESTFLSAQGAALGGEEIARQVYYNATTVRIRNENASMTMLESVRGSGFAILDAQQSREMRIGKLQQIADKNAAPLNLEQLFGGMDYCECGECLSVYSPASYFVELLQYLRNNNLDPANPNTGKTSITGTPLEKLFRRRPDLGCLDLTCENTFTVLPYIDLVNEVMESFVVHLDEYKNDKHIPKQATLEVFNVLDETSSELLAQPQHTNYEAYCILKSAVYPFTLPYHQSIDAIRIFLNYLGTSRYELLDTYRSTREACAKELATLPEADRQALQNLHTTILDRAVDAEFLGLTQEEYIILTKEAFWPRHYFEITLKQPISDADYRDNVGVKPVYEYYGYLGASGETDMLSLDESPTTGQKGLTFVKKQFLTRTGIQYIDLVALLKTRFINPNYPQGKALTILESIRFSYRFLQTLVDAASKDPGTRFGTLIDFLEINQALAPLLDAMLHPDPCHQHQIDHCTESQGLRQWVYCYFERIGKLIVLDSGQGVELVVTYRGKFPVALEGALYNPAAKNQVGYLRKDGTILDANSTSVIGRVTFDLKVEWHDGKSFADMFGKDVDYLVISSNNSFLAKLGAEGVSGPGEPLHIGWLGVQDTCDLDKVRLIHLDGTPLTEAEYDRTHRFIRLWRKLGWTIDETDKALGAQVTSSDGTGSIGTPSSIAADNCQFVGFDEFKDDCATVNGGTENGCKESNGPTGDWPCPDPKQPLPDITTDLLHQLAAIQKLLDQTGLPLPKLLTFWADISTAGDYSLYAGLFLTHNLLGIDKVFQADNNGDYLTLSAKITDHIPILMAALNLKSDDIAEIMLFRKIPDELALSNVSALYRHSLLAKLLHVKVANLTDIIALFGDPFLNPQATLDLLESWGKMEDAGFTFRQLNYLIQNRDDALRPLAPAQKTILQISKTLYDGLNAIDRDHPDTPGTNKELATDDMVRSKAGLLFEPAVVEQIIGLLDGTTVYTTNAPANQTIQIPDALAIKLKYNNQKDAVPPSASIQVTGILTDAEATLAKSLCASPEWPKAVDRVAKQAKNIFNEALIGIFPPAEQAGALQQLLAGDANISTDPQDPANTAPQKRFYLLKFFLPFLREKLAHRLIVDTLSGVSGVSPDIADLLLTDILMVGPSPGQAAIDVLKRIKDKPAGSPSGWKGYLIPPANDVYTFIAISDTQPASLVLDGQTIPFTVRQEDPSNVWFTDPNTPIKLKAGRLYSLELSDRSADQLQWKTASSAKTGIPSSALLPDFSTQGTEEAYTKLYKSALLVNGFSLDAEEVSYWQKNAKDFDGFDFNAVTLQHWKRLQAYIDLRNTLPKTDTRLLALFQWATKPDKPEQLSEKIAAATLWKNENIVKLLASEHFDLNDPAQFRNEINLVKLQKAVQIADKIGVDIDRLFEWAEPGTKFWACHQIAEDIRKSIRARFNQDDWEQVVKPLNDQLRENQKQALISYLLVQPALIDWGVVDADSLFEFFLIDVQMSACMQTSRIKQAISSVQLFVQRCFLGLEAEYGVANNVLDRPRWEWMQKYRVWEANRKVFLYPENWIDPQLRDDKSPFYKELEAELLQKDINTQTVQDALKNYLFKVDDVAHLQVVGLFLDGENNKLHVFARTHNAPYFFYYRYFQTEERNWYPWEKVQVDIPNYDMEDASSNQVQITENGAYLIPVVWNKRLLIFFPQLQKKTASNKTLMAGKTFKQIGDDKASAHNPVEYLEIKLGWSEYRNQKWTPKQLSTDAVYDLNPPYDVNNYRFTPRIMTGSDPRVVIEIFWAPNDPIGKFHFSGSQVFKSDSSASFALSGNTDFEVSTVDQTIHSLQAVDAEDPRPLMNGEPYFTLKNAQVTVQNQGVQLNFFHPFVHELLGKLVSDNLDDLFDYYLKNISDEEDTYGHDDKAVYHELKRAYSLYNWEAAFHAPMQLVDHLLKAQQFDQALNMIHYVFNPLAEGNDDKRFWQFLPFKDIDPVNALDTLFLGLKPNAADTPDGQINEWRNNPFQPHVIARSRPSAYMKYVVMKYIEILIAYGDYYFRQFTLETVPLAIQCYVLASHIYGPRGQKIPKRGKVQPQTYLGLLDKWDAFGNAMVELELVFPFSNQTPLPIGISNGVAGLANVFGFATTLYFCIPDNPQLKALRDTIDDRLFKIRHCQDIEGVFRQLPLFEPPIDPALLVQAAAQGLSLSSVLNDLNSPMPNYRFYYLLQKALELCNEVKGMGNAFLSSKEKGDAEALSQLRARHETSILNLVMEVKKQQLDEAQKSLDALQQSRLSPVSRMQYYLKLVGEDLGKVPDANTDFSELPNQIETPVDESGLKLIQYEKEEMDKASAAADWQTAIGATETLASILHVVPSAVVEAKPFGIGTSSTIVSGWMLGNATQSVARGMQTYAGHLTYQSSSASRKGSFLRQLQDRVQQANAAGYEIKHIDKQILAQQIRIDIANREITNQQQQIDNAKEVEDFLKNKYTNQDLYGWMEGQVRSLYYQAYTLAYDLAKRAEKIFRFERGLSTSNFIQFGYWDAGRDGLMSGERLYIGLKQLEAAYQEKRGYDFEISAPLSLRQINPRALLELKETGQCEFALPEVLFDMVRPGDYMRRIKSVALTIPCIVGPYTGLNCTLRLLEHKFRINALAKDKSDYPESTDATDERFSTVNVPITLIAASTGQNDSGVFELNFRDERYLPFEGAGAISKWRLEIPAALRQFDYDSITDVIMQLRYTAIDGGDKLKKAAGDSITEYIKSVEQLSRDEGLFAVFDLRHDFPNEWYKATQLPSGATNRVLSLDNLLDLLPIFTKGIAPKSIQATDVYLFGSTDQSDTMLITSNNPDPGLGFTSSVQVGDLKGYVNQPNTTMMGWQLRLNAAKPLPDKLWLLVRYVLA